MKKFLVFVQVNIYWLYGKDGAPYSTSRFKVQSGTAVLTYSVKCLF